MPKKLTQSNMMNLLYDSSSLSSSQYARQTQTGEEGLSSRVLNDDLQLLS